jgi:hypothetical protein
MKSGIKNYLREQIAFLVMIALLFGSFFSAFTISHEQISNLKNLEQKISLFGEKVLICTANGYEWKTWKEIAQEKNSAKPHDGVKCKLCHANCHSKDGVLGSVVASIQNWSAQAGLQVIHKSRVAEFSLTHSPPRSPPQFS